MVYAKFGGQTEYIMGNWKIENYSSFRTVYIDTVVLVIYAFYQFNDLRQKAPCAECWLYQAVPISGPGGRLH